MDAEIRLSPVVSHYADPLEILAGNDEINQLTDSNPLSNRRPTRLHYCCDYFINLFEDIRKSAFDSICSNISPSQIIGLKLGKTKFNLFDQYLLGRNGEQSFTNLRSLWLDRTISYNENLSRWMQSKINLNNLHSFHFTCLDGDLFAQLHNSSFENLSYLIGNSSRKFRQLSNGIPKHLRTLHMFFDTIDDLNDLIGSNAHQFYSLGVGFQCQIDNLHQFCSLFKNHQWTLLIQFNLNLQGINNIHFETIKYLLSSMFRLNYLTLIFSKQELIHQSDVLNGFQWELFISETLIYLKKFFLKIPLTEQSNDEINFYFNTFQSSWWINEKTWFIEYFPVENVFMTVTYFAPKIIDNSIVDSFFMMKRSELSYLNIREMKLYFDKLNPIYLSIDHYYGRFCNVNRLSLNGHLTGDIFINIRHLINIEKIVHFQISSTITQCYRLAQFIRDMTNLSSLHIQCVHVLHIFDSILSPLVLVRRLDLFGYQTTTRSLLLKRVRFLFPALIHLTIEYHSRRLFRYVLNELVHLEEIHFHLKDYDHVPNHHWIEQYTRLINHSFQSEVFNVNHKERTFVLWINQEKVNNQSIHHKCLIQ
ncbi:unnamed protein product [Adineta steineri]|uniref:Uncharacterized protein n=1 Tax=Adineta steineri TaxID=433720 RepID=A0A814FY22_9BILA|nr:unnamed protein product [Adineta steineri]CAF0988580.1 unnamed protein product [Adineta steineri]